jgi:hypothetical protein
MTKLGDMQTRAAATPTANQSTRLGAFVVADLRGEIVTLPVLGSVYMQLVGHDVGNTIEGQTFAEMASHGLPPMGITGLSYEGERAKRTLAEAVRDPEDHSKPFGTLEQWGKLDDDVIVACWHVYGDVRDRLDPIGLDSLTAEDVAQLDAALEKKNATALRSYGVAKLSLYLLTTAARPAISPTPPSSPGES